MKTVHSADYEENVKQDYYFHKAKLSTVSTVLKKVKKDDGKTS